MAHKVIKSSKRSFFTFKIKLLITGILLIALTSILCHIILYFNLESLFLNLLHYLELINAISILLLLFVILLLIFKFTYTHISKRPYLYLLYFQSDKWLQDVGLYLKNGENFVEVPKVRRISETELEGIEIEIIGDLREKMLLLNETLTSYIRRKGSNWFVIESYEVEDGFVRYVFVENISRTQLFGVDNDIL